MTATLDIYCRSSVDEWLPETHLARFIVDVVDKLDIAVLEKAQAGRGSAAYHSSVLLALLVYGEATGVFFFREIERAAYGSVAFSFIAAGSHPDHDALATFQRRILDKWAELLIQLLEIARKIRLLKLGTISLGGTKIHANVSNRHTLSQGHIEQLEIQLKGKSNRCGQGPSKPTSRRCQTEGLFRERESRVRSQAYWA